MDIGKDLQRAYDDGYEQGKQDAVKWIPVTERLPQIEKDVLVCAYGTLIRTWCLHKKYSKRFWETEEGYFDDFNAVSHWMPLPDLPKDGET